MKQVDLGFDEPMLQRDLSASASKSHTAAHSVSQARIASALNTESLTAHPVSLLRSRPTPLLPPITLVRDYLNAPQQAALLAEAKIYALSRPEINVFGKSHPIARKQAWFGDVGCDYCYSDLFIRAMPWPKYAQKLRLKLARDFGLISNGVLVNYYANGKDRMGAHSDDEPEIVHGSDIASLSLGASRDFVLKHKHSKTKYTLTLSSGDLLIMHWPMQQDWLHSLPKRMGVMAPRWNYTFRQLIVDFHKGHE